MPPTDPLPRFQALHRALEEHRRWFDSAMPFRYAAAALVAAEGDPASIAARVVASARRLLVGAGWFGSMRGSLRFAIAAVLVHDGDDAEAFAAEVERGGRELRRLGMWRGHGHEVIGILLLRRALGGKPIPDRAFSRFRDVYQMMKRHHPWLTGTNDYGACGLLAAEEGQVHRMATRIEACYERLSQGGVARGQELQLASHLLYLHPDSVDEVSRRYLALHQGFRDAGVKMWTNDLDELALLTFLSEPTERVVRRVLDFRIRVRDVRRVDAVESFSLASSLAMAGAGVRTARTAHLTIQVQTTLAAQAASVAAG